MSEPLPSLVPMVVQRIKELRHARGWSTRTLSEKLTEVGFSMPRSVLANIENMRRDGVTIDELAALGLVFGVEPWTLTSADMRCPVCDDSPPVGFTCNGCGNAVGKDELERVLREAQS